MVHVEPVLKPGEYVIEVPGRGDCECPDQRASGTPQRASGAPQRVGAPPTPPHSE